MLQLDPGSGVPPFEQLREHLLDRIRSGELAGGAKLPTVRGLASKLDLAPNTVARAYRELELAGVLETRGRNGTFVALSDDPLQRQAEQAAQSFVDQMTVLGVDAQRAAHLIERAFASR